MEGRSRVEGTPMSNLGFSDILGDSWFPCGKAFSRPLWMLEKTRPGKGRQYAVWGTLLG